MGKSDTAEFWDTLAKEFDFWSRRVRSFGFEETIYNEIMNDLQQGAKLALDAGCGTGGLSLRLADKIDYVVGIDISSSMITLAKSYRANERKDNIDFLVADLEELPFKEMTFDLVMSSFAMHSTRLDISLPSLSRVLKPGGRMIITDFISINPRLDASPTWQVLRSLKKALKLARLFSLRDIWRLVMFELNPVWIRHKCEDARTGKRMKPKTFEMAYSRFLPSCRFERHDGRMVALWEAPK